MKGRDAPVAVSRLVSAKGREPVGDLRPIVGREPELAKVGGILDELVSGRGQVVLVSGEAGIGKTRLLEEIRTIAGDRAAWLEGRCLSYGGLAAWPFVEILSAGWALPSVSRRSRSPTQARARLGPLLGEELDDVLPALGGLLRIKIEGRGDADDVKGAYARWLVALSAEQPVVLAVEDVHWADAPTRELAERVLELTDEAPVAVVLTQEGVARSEGAALRLHALGDFGHRTAELALDPLSSDAADELLLCLLAGVAELDRKSRGAARPRG